MGAWEDFDVAKTGLAEFQVVPFRSAREFSPKRKVPKKKEGPALCILAGIVKIGLEDQVTHALLVLSKLGALEVAFQELSNYLVLRHSADQPDRTTIPGLEMIL